VKGLGKFSDRLAKGSSILSMRIARGTVAWLQAGKGIGDFVIRLAFLVLPIWIAWSLLMATRALLWVLAVIWCIAAWRAAEPAKPKAKPTPAPPPGAPAPSRREEAGQETHPESGGVGASTRRVMTWPDPDHPHRTHVRVIEEEVE
jgi:hypothetical protein